LSRSIYAQTLASDTTGPPRRIDFGERDLNAPGTRNMRKLSRAVEAARAEHAITILDVPSRSNVTPDAYALSLT
jgi:hypothetical protein